MSKLAITNALGHVVQFVRADVPPGWQPPPGHKAVQEAALPAGYKMAAVEPPPVPVSVEDLSLRRALSKVGKNRRVIEAAIQGIADEAQRDSMIDWWDRRVEIRRDEPELRTLAGLLGMTDAQMDQAFRVAGGAQ
jgi:hypothetical protein